MADKVYETVERIAGGETTKWFLSKLPDVMRNDLKENFDRESDPDGGPWTPRSPGGRGNHKLLFRSGGLAASVVNANDPHHIEEVTADAVTMGSRHPLIHVHQDGMTIKPKRGKYLALPLTDQAEMVGNARDYPEELFCFRSKRGNLLLAEKKSKPLKVHYLLKESVTIPARVMIGIGERLAKKVEDLWVQAIRLLYNGEGA